MAILVSQNHTRPSRYPIIKSTSGPAHTHASLANVEITRYGPRIVNRDTFTCEGAVDAHRLLRLIRNDVYKLACYHGWNALTEEEWRCTISSDSKGRRKKYTVKVCYEATIARSPRCVSVHSPVDIEAAQGVDGVMTVLNREGTQKVTNGQRSMVDWWDDILPTRWSSHGYLLLA